MKMRAPLGSQREREICERGNVAWIEGEIKRERGCICMYCRVFLWRESCAGARRAWLDSRLNDPLLPAISFGSVWEAGLVSQAGELE